MPPPWCVTGAGPTASPGTSSSALPCAGRSVLGTKVTAAQVALCLCDLKLARLTVDPGHLDSLVDVAGYAAIVREVQR